MSGGNVEQSSATDALDAQPRAGHGFGYETVAAGATNLDELVHHAHFRLFFG